MKQYVIGDIHGHFLLLEKALSWVQTQEEGEVIFLGDYIDRGPRNKDVVDLLMAGPPNGWVWTFIRGNHEDMALEACVRNSSWDMWLGNGGLKTLSDFKAKTLPSEVLEFFAKMPRYKYDEHRIFSHALADNRQPIDKQSEEVTQWRRPTTSNSDYPIHDRYLVHGHTPQNGVPFVGKHRCNLDVGCVWSNTLAVAVFDTEIPGPPLHIETIKKVLL